MIYIKTSIEPLEGEEFDVVSISFMRKEEVIAGKSRYVYGGWYHDKLKEKHYFTNSVYLDRNENILEVIGKLCLDASKNAEYYD
jgi:hypothetical protein